MEYFGGDMITKVKDSKSGKKKAEKGTCLHFSKSVFDHLAEVSFEPDAGQANEAKGGSGSHGATTRVLLCCL